MRAEGAGQKLNEGATLTVFERVKLVCMCLPSIRNLAGRSHSLPTSKAPTNKSLLSGNLKNSD